MCWAHAVATANVANTTIVFSNQLQGVILSAALKHI